MSHDEPRPVTGPPGHPTAPPFPGPAAPLPAGAPTAAEAPPPAGPVRFAPVRPDKLIALYVATFGLYQLVWFWRNWRYVERAEDRDIWVWARTLFAPVMYYALLTRLPVRGRVGLAVAFWIIVGSWRLPDPYWLACLMGFLPLLPAVKAIEELNGPDVQRPPDHGWRGRSVVAAVLGGCVVLPLALIGTLGPPTAVIRGAEMRPAYVHYLRDTGLLYPDEEILYFYSAGLLSIEGDGVFASDLGITSYWVDPVTEELTSAFLAYEDIADITVNYAGGFFGETAVRVTSRDNAWFLFFLPSEAGGDRAFLEEVERRRDRPPEPGGVAT